MENGGRGMMEPVIQLERVTKDYGGGRGVFELSFAVGRGEVVGFLGANGAGKSVTMRLLMGFVRADGGRATLGGRPCFADRAAIQREVGYLPGELALPGDMTGRAFLEFVAGMRGTALPPRANALIDYFELDPSAKLRAMSKGTRQKVGIVAAFMHEPAVLLLDEPTSGLDLLMQRRFVELVRAEKRRGATILLSSHLLGEVEGTCDRALFVRSGRLTSEARAADLTLDATLEHLYGTEALRRRWGETAEGCAAGGRPAVLPGPAGPSRSPSSSEKGGTR